MQAICSPQYASKSNPRMLCFPAPGIGGRGIVFGRFLSLFLCQQHYEKTAGPICMKFSGKVWSDHGTDDLIKFWINSGKRVGGSKANLFVITGHSSEDWR